MSILTNAVVNENPTESELESAVQLLVFFSLMLACKTIADGFIFLKDVMGIEAMLKLREDGAFAVLNDDKKVSTYEHRIRSEMSRDFEAVMDKHRDWEKHEMEVLGSKNRDSAREINATHLSNGRATGEAGAFEAAGADEITYKDDDDEEEASAMMGRPAATTSGIYNALSSPSSAPANHNNNNNDDFEYQESYQQINVRKDKNGKIILPKSEWADEEDDAFAANNNGDGDGEEWY